MRWISLSLLCRLWRKSVKKFYSIHKQNILASLCVVVGNRNLGSLISVVPRVFLCKNFLDNSHISNLEAAIYQGKHWIFAFTLLNCLLWLRGHSFCCNLYTDWMPALLFLWTCLNHLTCWHSICKLAGNVSMRFAYLRSILLLSFIN